MAHAFSATIDTHHRSVLVYEDPSWQREALRVAPVDALLHKARAELAAAAAAASAAAASSSSSSSSASSSSSSSSPASSSSSSASDSSSPASSSSAPSSSTSSSTSSSSSSSSDLSSLTAHERDALMKQLAHWFKHEFFSWLDTAPCATCGSSSTSARGATAARADESRFGAQHTELFFCSRCSSITRFPRFNHALKLLETRRGRCGEWVQAFMLFVRALAFEARVVCDWTDHVWIEFYSLVHQRWIHVDPCENAIDHPLLYEKGWGKKLTYIVAFSRDECVDVTRRYTEDYTALKTRRVLCAEPHVQVIIATKNLLLWRASNGERQKVLLQRSGVEQMELQGLSSINRVAAQGALTGRTTGSEQWRRNRGEIGDEQLTAQAVAEQERQQQAARSAASSSSSSSSAAAVVSSASTVSSSPASSTATTAACTAAPSVPAPSAPSAAPASAASAPSDASQPSAASSTDAAKQRAALLFQRYRDQLTTGCGNSQCNNAACASNPAFVRPSSAPALAVLALQLTAKSHESALCSSLALAPASAATSSPSSL